MATYDEDTYKPFSGLEIPFKRFQDQTLEEQAETIKRIERLLRKETEDLANLKHQMKAIIWTASQESKILDIDMKNGLNYYGIPNFAIGETYETPEKLNEMFCFDILVANGIYSNSALGGGSRTIFISGIDSIRFYEPPPGWFIEGHTVKKME